MIIQKIWTPERKAAEMRLYRAQCRIRCLEANLDRVDPDQFDALMAQLEAAQTELSAAVIDKCQIAIGQASW